MGNKGPKIQYDKVYKIVAWGDQRVGKTAIFEKYLYDKIPSNYHPTNGQKVLKRDLVIDGKNVGLCFFDSTGNIFFRGAIILNATRTDLFMFVYSIIDKATFVSVKTFIPAFQQKFEEKNAIKILIGNKTDLYNRREVTREEGESLAKEHQMIFIETSAMTGEGINDLFNCIGEKLIARYKDEVIHEQNMSPPSQPAMPIDYSQQNRNSSPQLQVTPQNTINNNINSVNKPAIYQNYLNSLSNMNKPPLPNNAQNVNYMYNPNTINTPYIIII